MGLDKEREISALREEINVVPPEFEEICLAPESGAGHHPAPAEV
jgi:hypothetical protein